MRVIALVSLRTAAVASAIAAAQASYDADKGLTGYAFSDGKTANLTFGVARMGGIKSTTVAGGIGESYGLNLEGERNLVTVAGNNIVKSHAVAYYRLPGGGGISQVAFDPEQVRAIDIGYDTARRAYQVTDGAVQATYARAGNAPAVGQIVLKVSGTERLTANYSYNGARQMVTNVAWSAGGPNVASFGYGASRPPAPRGFGGSPPPAPGGFDRSGPRGGSYGAAGRRSGSMERPEPRGCGSPQGLSSISASCCHEG